jgi:hypothetical protein
MFLASDAEDLTLMNKSYTYKKRQSSASQAPKTDTHFLIDTVMAYSNLDFTWKQQLLIRICCCCKRKDRHSMMFHKGKKQLYEEMDLIKLIRQLRVAALMS